jgi:hypothetical protein
LAVIGTLIECSGYQFLQLDYGYAHLTNQAFLPVCLEIHVRPIFRIELGSLYQPKQFSALNAELAIAEA